MVWIGGLAKRVCITCTVAMGKKGRDIRGVSRKSGGDDRIIEIEERTVKVRKGGSYEAHKHIIEQPEHGKCGGGKKKASERKPGNAGRCMKGRVDRMEEVRRTKGCAHAKTSRPEQKRVRMGIKR